MWLGWKDLVHLMWECKIFFPDDLWSEGVESIKLSLELSSSFLGGGVNTENNLLVLIGMGEWVEVLLWVIEMTVVSQPGWVWHLIVEKSWGSSFTELLKSEPFNNVWFLSLSPELHWSPFSTQVSHGIIPGLSRVGINLPSVSLFRGGPVWNLETLEESSRSSVERNISYSLEKGGRMEILGIDMMHNIWLLMEFVAIEILNSNTYLIMKFKWIN